MTTCPICAAGERRAFGATPDFIPLVASNLVVALLISFTFDRWANVRTFTGGVKAAAIVMFLFSMSADLSVMGCMNLFKGFGPVLVEVLAETVRVALAGGVIGMVLRVTDRDPGWPVANANIDPG